MTGRQLSRGFTLIELMMVSAIIGLLATIAVPKFGNLIIRAKEATVEGELGSLRSACAIYYADNDGFWPLSGTELIAALTTGGRYLDRIPTVSIPTVSSHGRTKGLYHTNFLGNDWDVQMGQYAWAYFPMSGQIKVNCTHPDSKGRIWSQK